MRRRFIWFALCFTLFPSGIYALSVAGGAQTVAGSGSGDISDRITSSTMAQVNGATDGQNQTAISLQVNSSTKGYVDGFGVLNWGNFTNSRQIHIGTNSWVGIGITPPLASLHVRPHPNDGDNDNLIAYFDGTSQGGVSRIWFRPVNSTAGQYNLDFNAAAGHSVWKYNFDLVPTPDQFWFTFALNNANIMTMRDTGRVGINTPSPTAALEVSSGAGFTGQLLIVSTGATKLFEVTGSSAQFSVPLTVTSTVTFKQGIVIGTGTTNISYEVIFTTFADIAQVNAVSTLDTTLQITGSGLSVNDFCVVQSTALEANLQATSMGVVTANTVVLRLLNPSAIGVNPANQPFKFRCWR